MGWPFVKLEHYNFFGLIYFVFLLFVIFHLKLIKFKEFSKWRLNYLKVVFIKGCFLDKDFFNLNLQHFKIFIFFKSKKKQHIRVFIWGNVVF